MLCDVVICLRILSDATHIYVWCTCGPQIMTINPLPPGSPAPSPVCRMFSVASRTQADQLPATKVSEKRAMLSDRILDVTLFSLH